MTWDWLTDLNILAIESELNETNVAKVSVDNAIDEVELLAGSFDNSEHSLQLLLVSSISPSSFGHQKCERASILIFTFPK